MLLAAGRGVRMGPLTEQLPKPLLEVGGQSLIERHLVKLGNAGIADVVINVSYLGDRIQKRLGNGRAWGVNIEYSQEPEPPLETAGGIVNALPLLGIGPFLLINADILTDFDYRRLALSPPPPDHADSDPSRAHGGILVLVPNPPHHQCGDFALAADGCVAAAGDRLTFSGISVLDTAMFDSLAPGPRALKPVLDEAIERRALAGLMHRSLWLDVGTPERLQRANTLISAASEPAPR
jgi:MurNAc alpha-1-phosphate uridylyltransferase